MHADNACNADYWRMALPFIHTCLSKLMVGITSPFSAKWGKGYSENHYQQSQSRDHGSVSTETII